MPRSIKRDEISAIGIAVSMITLSACSLAAQTASEVSPSAALECFETSIEDGLPRSMCRKGLVTVERIMYRPAMFLSSEVDAVADGLEQLAPTSENVAVRATAVGWLGILGTPAEDTGRPVPGAVQRLERVYEKTSHEENRSAILMLMGRQADHAGAARFLSRVATSTASATLEVSLPAEAVSSLARLGPDGVSALKQLQAEGCIRDPQARAALERLAEADFQVKKQ